MSRVIIFLITILFVASLNVIAQESEHNYNQNQVPTTMEIYNYVKSGYKTQIAQGLDMKKGYFVWDKLTRGVTSSDGQRTIEFKALVTENTFKICAWIGIYRNPQKGEHYFCIPTQISSQEVWQKAFADFRDANFQATAYLPISWGLMNLVGQLTNDYGTVCFPADAQITMKDGSSKAISEIKRQDEITYYDIENKKSGTVLVEELLVHQEAEYSVTKITAINTDNAVASTKAFDFQTRNLEATDNHPILTARGIIAVKELKVGDKLLFQNSTTGEFNTYQVVNAQIGFRKVNKVYNLKIDEQNTFLINGFVMMVK